MLQFSYDGPLEAGAGLDESRLEEHGYAYSITWTWPYEDATSLAGVSAAPDRETPYQAMAGGGMCSFVRSEVFHGLGKYDPEVPGWNPETMDYCVRGWLLGSPMMVEPEIRVRHRVGGHEPSWRYGESRFGQRPGSWTERAHAGRGS